MSAIARSVAAALLALVAGTAMAADAPAASPGAGAAPAPAAVAAAASRPARVDLDASSIRGSQELPRVLYIVPWKDSAPTDPAGRPLNSLVDEALAPVDREVLRRQMTYFDQLYAPVGVDPGVGNRSP